ncbi:MFS transporter [Luteimicrobium subarcticum]|uniref:MFS transporter n=1 Tax=Luteimicrobium subarcticum TaxID=620910 RepID=A0A2M8W1B8_9MICO|nr:MFS transporter [Luteimicrobium subarcticum]PJI84724.1 MFS transporter [Luteimicrobium subarcticum]
MTTPAVPTTAPSPHEKPAGFGATPEPARDRVAGAAWAMLALGVAAQAAGTFLVSIPVFLIPLLHVEQGVPLVRAGLLASAPTLGMVLTLVAWGALADRRGERGVIAGGLALAAVVAAATLPVHGLAGLGVMFGLAGAAAASTNAASGRVVVGWFPRSRRGLAMGIRQMSQPLGAAAAALAVPALASAHGVAGPLVVAAAVLAVLAVACAVVVRNPPRSAPPGAAARATADPAPANPYRRDAFLVRVHALSALLVLPQFTLSTFGMVWLVTQLGWRTSAAGVVIGLAQVVGAVGRIGVGALSDGVGSRVRVLRWVAASGVVLMASLALAGALSWSAAGAALLVVATTVSVADNGLAYTSVAEAAGSSWSGRALGIQNTGQFLAASAVGPVVGAGVAGMGFPLTFALVALAPATAWRLIPRRDRDDA